MYYVHLNTEKDADLLREAEETLLAENPDDFPPMTGVPGQKHAVRRKPVLPSRPNLGAASQHGVVPAFEIPSKTQLKHNIGAIRTPVGPENVKKVSLLPGRKLVGPRPFNGLGAGLKVRDINMSAGHRDAPLSSIASTERLATSTRKQYTTKQMDLDRLYESNIDIDNRFAGFRLSLDASSSESSMTLIRRYDGLQFNVGRIHANGRINIEGNGYRKFNDVSEATANGSDECTFTTHVGRMGSAAPQFLTPWKTKCQFAAGIGGRTLRCTHAASERPQSSSVMSELRFNLPSLQALRSAPKRPLSEQGTSSKRASFMRLHKRGRSEMDINHDGDDGGNDTFVQGKMDLSLGQELAGGGFGGKSAKIAKLIIHPGGFPMLDLLVAGNLSVFSKIYGKNGPD